jgi:GNAT superfamily N-acetyltransferase
MSVSIVPFTADHLEAAATLLAARHGRARVAAPMLSAEYEDPAVTLPVLQGLLADEAMSGVVALDAGRVVGYLLGAPEFGSPTHPFAGFIDPRAATIPFAGHAVEPHDGASLYPRLYATLAQRWVGDGLLGHNITVPATPEVAEAWWNLGFGRRIALSARTTTLPEARDSPRAVELAVRRAAAQDEGAVYGLVTEFVRSTSDPPIFLPFLPETTAERRKWVADHLADPNCPCWLAFAEERPVALHLFEEPASPLWHQSALETPPRAVYLHIACTAPEARSTGIGAALLHHTMAWARAAGYGACLAHYLTSSRASLFWRGLGFQPVSYWLVRAIDDRATWANDRR